MLVYQSRAHMQITTSRSVFRRLPNIQFVHSLEFSYLLCHPPGQTGRRRYSNRRIVTFLIIAPHKYSYLLTYLLTYLFVRSFVRASVTNLVNTIFWMNRFWCKLAQVVRGARAWNDQRSRSREAEDRFGGLAEASLSTALGRVALLVGSIRQDILASLLLWR